MCARPRWDGHPYGQRVLCIGAETRHAALTLVFDRDALNRVYRYALALCNDEALAADLLQDGLERYLRAAGRGENDHPDTDKTQATHPEALLRRIVRNRCIDLWRARRDEEPFDAEAPHIAALALDVSSLEDCLIAEDELAQLWATLAPAERELLHLWAVEGHTAQEIATLQACPRGTVLARIHRLRQRLRSHPANPYREGTP